MLLGMQRLDGLDGFGEVPDVVVLPMVQRTDARTAEVMRRRQHDRRPRR